MKKLNDFQKSPLRYPGGKSRGASAIADLFPPVSTLVSPFLGGASIEIEATNRGIKVYGYDAFPPLIAFWRRILNDPKGLANDVKKWHPLPKERFYALQEKVREGIPERELSTAFFVLNRASFSGATLSGGMSPGHLRFTESSIQRVREFQCPNLSASLMNFEESIKLHPDDFLYCDPPYAVDSKLYGSKGDCHKGFNHVLLAEILTGRKNWLLSYNDSPFIRELYAGYEIKEMEWAYGMNASRKSNEILIFSRGYG